MYRDDDPHRGGHQQDDEHQPEPIARHRHAVHDRDRLAREDRIHPQTRIVGEPSLDQRGDDDHEADAGHDVGQRRRSIQRFEDELVDDQPHQRCSEQCEQECPPDPDVATEVIPVRKTRYGERVGTLTQLGVDVARPGGHRPIGEVHQAGALIRHHETEAERRDDRAGPGSEEDEEQIVSHRVAERATSQIVSGVERLEPWDRLDVRPSTYVPIG